MKKIVLAAAVATSLVATAFSAQANRYIDPNAPFNAARFFESLPSGQ